MSPVASLFSILAALSLGAVSPGPSFLFVTRTSMAVSRRHGVASAIGMGLGASIVCSLALLGVRAVLAQAEWLYICFKLLGGAYLLYLAWRLWRGAGAAAEPPGEPLPVARGAVVRSFWLALATQLSNPKTLVVISGIFAALLPSRVPAWMYWTIPPLDMLIETSWYTFVAIAMSSAAPRRVYLRARAGIDRAAGCLLGAVGLRLVSSIARVP
ncbi:MAG TPA: LysE family transporter [Steroidobacteraceae bacterium]|nr:LysE family transporter [Steroidobacteraceae bacterium]